MSMSVEQFERPFERAGIAYPGLPILPHGTERHPISPGGSRALQVLQGDHITVVDRQGRQPAEIVFFTASGKADVGALGLSPARKPKGLQAALSQGDESGARVLRNLSKAGFDVARSQAAILFAHGSPAGESETFHAHKDGLLIVCAVAEAMNPGAQNTSTDLVLYIRRAKPGLAKDDRAPADPLADPILDINIQPGQAKTYEVKKGQYFQIMDVQGRECTDFQAFSMRALDKGLERDIDPTTTRSLMGSLWPGPGLFSKFFSVDHEPLVEIIQDTCGQHDTFGLACTARYYEDLGYPGHVNCSDNITARLEKYSIGPRAGWPAINFFFNTRLDDTNAISMDDPWSRPGDYVLLRALTDLVCVSTACPCDIDPANGWNPTDIQVRTYDEKNVFAKSVGWRATAGGDVSHTLETGFHKSFAAHTRNFVEYKGYWLAQDMAHHGSIAEYWAAREKAVVMDLSPLRKFEITGPDAEQVLQACVTRDMKKLSVGQVVYTAICYEHGGMIDDGTVFRLGNTNFRWVCGHEDSGNFIRDEASRRGLNAWVRNSTHQLHNIAVQGPKSCDILRDLIWTGPTWAKIEELEWFRFSVGRIGDFHGPSIVVSRTGYSGELGYEIFCHPKDCKAVFDAVWKAGEPHGLVPLGLGALDMLRIEAGLVFAGCEFSDQTDPFEAGIGFTVPLKTKDDDFAGKEALIRRKASPQRKLIGLDIAGGLVPASGDGLYVGKARVGEITSAMKSPILGKVIALARVDVTYAELETEIDVGQLDGLQKRLRAKVVPFPHFDPKKNRVRGS